MEKEKFDFLFKIVLVGDSNVGKTNILSRLINNKVPESSRPTIGVEFGTKTFKFNEDIVKAQIWDTAGQERYHAITSAYYRGSCGAVIVYDISKKSSLENAISIWLKNLKQAAEPEIPIMLMGNKEDLNSNREIPIDEARHVAARESLGFFETSALSGTNVNVAFETLAKEIYEKEKKKANSPTKVRVRREDLITEQLKSKNMPKRKRSCC